MIVSGPDLPRRLGLLERFHLCTMLGSAVYFRRNGNGFAELDLILEPDVLERIGRVRAVPGQPTNLGHAALAALGCPQITRIVRSVQDELGQGANQVSLQSVFRLELQYVEQVTYPGCLPGSVVFLLGDAAVSLPYFRGMASLTASAHALAETHCALVDAHLAGLGEAALQSRARQYDQAVQVIRAREVRKVRQRARHAALLREYGRFSALVASVQPALLVARQRMFPANGGALNAQKPTERQPGPVGAAPDIARTGDDGRQRRRGATGMTGKLTSDEGLKIVGGQAAPSGRVASGHKALCTEHAQRKKRVEEFGHKGRTDTALHGLEVRKADPKQLDTELHSAVSPDTCGPRGEL